MVGAGDTTPAGRDRAPLIDLDLAGLARALWASRLWIIAPTLAALALSFAAVSLTAPTYRSEARILVENGESSFTRPESDRSGGADRAAVDQEAVLSQVQLILSRDVAKAVAQKLDLARKPEFDPALRSFNPVRQVLTFLGLAENPMRMTAEERVLRSYFEKLTAYQVDKSRIIAIQFDSQDPALAAEAANMVAAQFIEAQQANKRSQTRNASQWLSGEVDGLRRKVEEAEGRVESFRARANLFVGTNNTSLTAQQLAEVNSQIAAARAQQSDAQTRARLLRDFLRSGHRVRSSIPRSSAVSTSSAPPCSPSWPNNPPPLARAIRASPSCRPSASISMDRSAPRPKSSSVCWRTMPASPVLASRRCSRTSTR